MKKTLTFNQLIKKNKGDLQNDRDQLKRIELKIDARRVKNSK
ncbi:FbpB family small basic protein [Sporolactobacillus laevolacticus]|nr:FbpB family small basic protein [Sporolactobacillus laevolacticus]MDN3956737.1 FbpB family small basic protein [Sporolactobacillus laevolacticus]